VPISPHRKGGGAKEEKMKKLVNFLCRIFGTEAAKAAAVKAVAEKAAAVKAVAEKAANAAYKKECYLAYVEYTRWADESGESKRDPSGQGQNAARFAHGRGMEAGRKAAIEVIGAALS